MGEGLIESGAYLKFWLRVEGLNREGGLIELLRYVSQYGFRLAAGSLLRCACPAFALCGVVKSNSQTKIMRSTGDKNRVELFIVLQISRKYKHESEQVNQNRFSTSVSFLCPLNAGPHQPQCL